MMFWVICVAMVLLVLTVVLRPMLQSRDTPETAPDVAIYKAQLAEIDRDLARDVLAPDEADRARTEVARRLLAASKSQLEVVDGPRTAVKTAIVATLIATLAFTVSTYIGTRGILSALSVSEERIEQLEAVSLPISIRSVKFEIPIIFSGIGAPGEPDQPLTQRLANAEQLREDRPEQAALEAAAPEPAPIDAPPEYLASVAELRRLMAERPEDLQGHELLAFHEAEMQDYAAAADAQAIVIALKGDTAEIEDSRILLDLLVTAADGFVSPEAEALALQILEQDAENTPARYYLGSLYAQTGRPDLAFRFWRPLVETGTQSFHTALARQQITSVAELSGLSYKPPPVTGPSLADIEAAENLTDADRQAMIAGMVAGLADRLATQGGGPADWARLITAYGVLGETTAASEVWAEARGVFGADDNAMRLLRDAARSAGVLDE